MTPALELALFVLQAAVTVGALLALLVLVRALAAIRAYVGVLAAMPEITPQVTVQAPAVAPASGAGTSPPPDAATSGLPPAWAEFYRRMWGPQDPETDEPTDVRTTPPYPGDEDNFRGGAIFGEPAAKSKAREALEEDEA
jgi:hypothetical protein